MANTVEQEVLDALNQLGILWQLVHHEPVETMEDLAQLDRKLSIKHPKNLFLCNRQKTSFYLLLMEGRKTFRTATVSKQLGVARLSFANPEYLWSYLKTKPGGISPFGLLFDQANQVSLVIDRDLQKEEAFCFHPCVQTASVIIKSKDFFEVFLPATGHRPIWVNIEPDLTEAVP